MVLGGEELIVAQDVAASAVIQFKECAARTAKKSRRWQFSGRNALEERGSATAPVLGASCEEERPWAGPGVAVASCEVVDGRPLVVTARSGRGVRGVAGVCRDGCAGGRTAAADVYVALSWAYGCPSQIKRCSAMSAPAPHPGTRPPARGAHADDGLEDGAAPEVKSV
ncbi:hypothetical protein Efla_006690 [Eimeria flavescens]